MSLQNSDIFLESLILIKAMAPIERLFLNGYLARCYWCLAQQVPDCEKNLAGISTKIIEYAIENYKVDESIMYDLNNAYEIGAKALEISRLIFMGKIEHK